MLVPVLPNNRFDEAALTKYLAGAHRGFSRSLRGAPIPGRFLQSDVSPADGGSRLRAAQETARTAPAVRARRRSRVQGDEGAAGHRMCPCRACICCATTTASSARCSTSWTTSTAASSRIACCRAARLQQRRAMYDACNDVLAQLHRVDYRAVGLDGLRQADRLRCPASVALVEAVRRLVHRRHAGDESIHGVAARQHADTGRSDDRARRLPHRQPAVPSDGVTRRGGARLGAVDDRPSARRSRLLLQRLSHLRRRRTRLRRRGSRGARAFRRKRSSWTAIVVESGGGSSRTGRSSSCSRCFAQRRFSPASIDAASTARASTRAWRKRGRPIRTSPRERGRSHRRIGEEPRKTAKKRQESGDAREK